MTGEEKSGQMFRAIAMSNRVTVAKIKLTRAERLSEIVNSEIKEIDKSIGSLSDCLIIGDDVRSSLDGIEKRVEALETWI